LPQNFTSGAIITKKKEVTRALAERTISRLGNTIEYQWFKVKSREKAGNCSRQQLATVCGYRINTDGQCRKKINYKRIRWLSNRR